MRSARLPSDGLFPSPSPDSLEENSSFRILEIKEKRRWVRESLAPTDGLRAQDQSLAKSARVSLGHSH
ncbi:hypothetical protein PtB15_7B519 [Puccinia triticina]|nr:hypothetical protein PtB15_7B519 [Puccinia triticina]